MRSLSKLILDSNFELISFIQSTKKNFLKLKLFDGTNTYNAICHHSSSHKLQQAKMYHVLFEIDTDCRVPVYQRNLNVLEINRKF